MIPSMFSLDHKLSEIRPSEHDLRVSRELRDAADPASRPARSLGDTVRQWFVGLPLPGQPSRLATD
jgi:hypothetical protein